ncbi:hypothetical protein [Paraburkholderia caffeinilytica]
MHLPTRFERCNVVTLTGIYHNLPRCWADT